MNIEILLDDLAQHGVFLAVRNGKLICKARDGALTPERRQTIAERKAEFTTFLEQMDAAADSEQVPIPRRAPGPVPLSPAQQRLWFIEQLTDSEVSYTIPVSYRLIGPLNVEALGQALHGIVARHESLRSVIADIDGRPCTQLLAAEVFQLVVEDLGGLAPEERERQLHQRLHESLSRAFKLREELPLRARLLRIADMEHVLLLSLHHIAGDGWSVENLLGEMSALYTAYLEGRGDPLPALPLQYGDYAAWQQTWLQGERLEKQRRYWCEELSDIPPAHDLPLDFPRPAQALSRGASVWRRLGTDRLAALKVLAQGQGVTLFMLLQTAFAVFVARWSGVQDVVVGTPVANRPRNELAKLIGYFANTLALRTRLDGDPRFSALLLATRRVALDAYEHQNLPFEMVVEVLNPPRSLNLAPVFQLMFSLVDVQESAAIALPGLKAEAMLPDASNAKFDLNLALWESDEGLGLHWEYCSELFREATITRFADSFERLLASILATPDAPVSELGLLAEDEAELAVASGEVRALSDALGVHQLVETLARQQPTALAVSDGSQALSYGELDARANRLAHRLRELGVGPDCRVALHAYRSGDMLVGMLAVMKAGGAYVPLDPAHPRERLASMLDDSGAKVLLYQGALENTFPDSPIPRLRLDATELDGYPDVPVHIPDLNRRHLAYVLYTSGSTGTPKGVMVTHEGLLNLVDDCRRRFADEEPIRAAQWASFGFDVSVFETFVPLALGGSLHIVPEDLRTDPSALLDWLRDLRISFAYLPPFVVRAWREQADQRLSALALRRVLVGVESLPEDGLYRLERLISGLRVINAYGPTEITVFATCYEAPRELQRSAPIGRPIANTRLRVVDEALRTVPAGMVGELLVGGAGVAHGYLNQPEMSAERFIVDAAGLRWYRTGDRARWLPEGHLEFHGRKDQQIKLNGVRIEPGEIEAALAKHPAVREAAVVLRGGPNKDSHRLIAYVASREAALSADRLREHLQRHLPAYMLPAAYVVLPALPQTVSGKLDARALPEPELAAFTGAEHQAPANSLEGELAGMWQELLALGKVSVTASFFDLGGHSLLLTRLHNRITAHYGLDLPLRELFAAQSVRAQAQLIAVRLSHGAAAETMLPLQRRPAGVGMALSYAQRRLWFIDRMGNAGAVYNIPCALRLDGPLDAEALRLSLERIVLRHEVLRTTLREVAGEPEALLLSDARLELPLHDLSVLDAQARDIAVREAMNLEAAHPFDLARDLFLRAQLLKLGSDRHVLLLTLHHIASDGWSMGVLLAELARLYESIVAGREPQLPALDLQYADYSHWQRNWLQGERLEDQLRYWRKQLAGLPTLHQLPLDFERPDIQRYRGAVHWQKLPAALLEALQQLARRRETTLFITLQAAFAVLLARWSGEQDIVFGTPIANRRHEALSPLIGFFVNTLVLRMDVSGDPTFMETLERAKRVALDAYQHQDLPFEMLVEHLHPQRSLSHSPLFQVMLSLETGGEALRPFGGLELTDIASDSHHAKFDLTLNLRESAQGLEACWDYNRDLFRPETIARMADSFAVLLDGLVRVPESGIFELPVMADAERARLRVLGQGEALPPSGARCLHELFEEQAERAPNAIAVVHGDQSLSYGELNRRANRLARHLRRFGIQPDSRVAICLERGTDLLVGLLAIVKAGAAYVPLDPDYPPERLAYMLRDCEPRALLSNRPLAARLPEGGVPHVLLDEDAQAIARQAEHNLEAASLFLQPQHLAYVIYTSGSTGRPKGVMVAHGAVVHLWRAMEAMAYRALPARARIACNASISFDASLQYLVQLLSGRELHLIPQSVRVDAPALLSWLERRDIDALDCTPSQLETLFQSGLEDARALHRMVLLIGGEAIPAPLWQRIRRLGLPAYNVYGPTECTVNSTLADIAEESERPNLGRPLPGVEIRLLDSHGNPVPVGVVGEIHIGGAGLARAYLNREELTAERFVADHERGGRLYRTGDRGRWTCDGRLEYLGRDDFQVKIRGFRIEPGEIEAEIAAFPGVAHAAVLAVDVDAGERHLVAYLVAAQEHGAEAVLVDALKRHLDARLPAHMLPSAFMLIARLPLTPSGKLDRRALPKPGREAYSQSEFLVAETATEKWVAGIWHDLLKLERIGVNDNFFDLGGHSLNAVKLMSAIREHTGKTLPIAMLFQAPTVRSLARRIDSEAEIADDPLVPLRAGTERTPLFLFHAAGGDVLCYQALARHLPHDLPVYGFNRVELANQRVPAFRSQEELAEDYLVRILDVQGDGPYQLAGWSSGGLLAMEVAARLERRGKSVALLAVVDTMLATGTDIPVRFHKLGLAHLQGLDEGEACALMREFDPALAEAVVENGRIALPASDYVNYLIAANQIGIDFHRPDYVLKSSPHYFGCGRNTHLYTVAQRVAQLQNLTLGAIRTTAFDTDHFAIMDEPMVERLAEAISPLLY